MKEQIVQIQEALAEAGIKIWSLREETVSSAELFFIRRRLDMRRMKETVKYPVTVYHPFQKDGKQMLGSSEVTLLPTQSKEPQDVETYHSFAYEDLDCADLSRLVETALAQVSDRAVARQALPSGTYDLILSEDNLGEVLGYYVDRTRVSMVYPGYSTWQVGSDVQESMNGGERLELTLHASEPFSREGIPMSDRKLLADGKVQLIHGGARLSSYLGIAPTGDYTVYDCGNGHTPLAQLKEKPYLYPVCFSDFQMDAMTGHFGGEIRLAYYFDGKQVQIVTGGSVNGSIAECAGGLLFSQERYRGEHYRGPFAARIPQVKVAGTI